MYKTFKAVYGMYIALTMMVMMMTMQIVTTTTTTMRMFVVHIDTLIHIPYRNLHQMLLIKGSYVLSIE